MLLAGVPLTVLSVIMQCWEFFFVDFLFLFLFFLGVTHYYVVTHVTLFSGGAFSVNDVDTMYKSSCLLLLLDGIPVLL